MNRRELLTSAGTLAMAGAALTTAGSLAFAGEHEHDHHHHDGNKHAALIKSSLECMRTAEACINHCIDVMASGDTSLAKCAKRVQELDAGCSALFKMATYDSVHLKAYAKAAAAVCEACETECRKHNKHASCLACADACKGCMKACQALLA